MITDEHREQLRDYYSGVYAGRMGLVSWAGPMLDHAQSAALHPIDRSMDYMPVAPVDHSSQRANREIGEDAMQAARDDGRMRATLRRLDVDHVRVLRLAYTPQPKTATSALVCLALGERLAHELSVDLVNPDREKRRVAKKLLDSGEHQAQGMLDIAHAAFAEAAEAERDANRAEKRHKMRLELDRCA